ncbi:hypothetical protein GJ744_006921 [Endocarpon pusillum]|uniref:Uncharacterized protein n=1 Tax=Endocarpon pusillum TaxID=364733 RepID=A0A8H7AJF7_9EURO|nr:hypothetical protein GJ744_006921 [Endocarpon pusillum]
MTNRNLGRPELNVAQAPRPHECLYAHGVSCARAQRDAAEIREEPASILRNEPACNESRVLNGNGMLQV